MKEEKSKIRRNCRMMDESRCCNICQQNPEPEIFFLYLIIPR